MPETLCFDMYGTLCDTSSVTSTLADELGAPDALVSELDATWRAKQLQYSYQSALMEEYRPFWDVTADALAYALNQWGVEADDPTRERILAAYEHLDPYPDAIETLTRLSEAGHTVTVLSNGNPEMLETLADNAGLAPHLDDVISADEVSTFKPNPAVYENAADRTDTPIDGCRLVSGNAWDVAGAGSAGMATAWVNRASDPFEEIGVGPSLEVRSLSEVADELA
ncbi:haloacid dehalogenase type II [Halobaculum magnesiiphilum]|uniref:Haloacid dehalogenase type II n=1 Tax=Halobaculum magnesiiphilum TaxID=1017351 RepID=A0A8T8WAB0_9EURY|nr:haloacid dehalogenase type II [Halobaculum magnesiiphilum]QZP36761.1 haloacid dehalogenase type II [Halobaculum magnesiiphilum]